MSDVQTHQEVRSQNAGNFEDFLSECPMQNASKSNELLRVIIAKVTISMAPRGTPREMYKIPPKPYRAYEISCNRQGQNKYWMEADMYKLK